jgi:hypothetical protein
MTRRTLSRTLLTLTVLIGIADVWLSRELAEATDELSALRRSRANLDTQLERLRAGKYPAMRNVSLWTAELPAERPTRMNRTGGSTVENRSRVGAENTVRLEYVRSAWDDPALQRAYLEAERGRVAMLYASIARQLGLSNEERNRLFELIAQRDEQRLDISTLVLSHGLEPSSTEVVRLWSEISASFARSLNALIGGAGYVVFVEYERKLPVQPLVSNFAGAMAMQGEPLSPAQGEALTGLLAQSSASYQQGGAANPNDIDWTEAVEKAAVVLTPPQIVAFRNVPPSYPVAVPTD